MTWLPSGWVRLLGTFEETRDARRLEVRTQAGARPST